jgi:hypothetical protein
MYQQLWGYKVEEKLYLGAREQKRLNTTGLNYTEVEWRQTSRMQRHDDDGSMQLRNVLI